MTPTFKAIGKEVFDITEIYPMRKVDGGPADFADDKPVNMCNGAFAINKIGTDGNYEGTYNYFWTKAKKGWYLGTATSEPVAKGTVFFRNGEAMLVNNKLTSGAAYFRVSGEVDLTCDNVIPSQNSLFGNSTPVEIDLTDVTMYRLVENVKTAFSDDKPANMCNGAFAINKIGTDGNYEATYNYFWTKAKKGWYLGTATSKPIAKGTVPLRPGEAILINNKLSNGVLGVMELPKPIKE